MLVSGVRSSWEMVAITSVRTRSTSRSPSLAVRCCSRASRSAVSEARRSVMSTTWVMAYDARPVASRTNDVLTSTQTQRPEACR